MKENLASQADVVLCTESRDSFLPDVVIPLSTILALGSSWAFLPLASGNHPLRLHHAGVVVVCQTVP